MGLTLENEFNSGSTQSNVAIAGFDIEGKATYEYLKSRPNLSITILDQKPIKAPAGTIAETGPDVFDKPLDFDQIWRTPGLAPNRLKTAADITSGTIEFFNKCPAKIIGVTGSKGKGTTATLIAKILEFADQTCHLIGNIGKPALSVLPHIKKEDVVVYELSSFQLWDLKASPQIAVVLMVEPDHLDVHRNLADYLSAKSNIARWQGPDDLTIYFGDSEMSSSVAKVGLGQKVAVPSVKSANISDGQLWMDNNEICQTSDFGLRGEHNHNNILAAITAAWQFTPNTEAVKKAVTSFTGLEHRLQLIDNKRGIDFIDDSISTTPTSAVAALQSFQGPRAIILGGSDKGISFEILVNELAKTDNVSAILIGQTAEKIKQQLDQHGFTSYSHVTGDMAEAVKQAVNSLKSGGTVLLSPACASFDMFKDYRDRADKFKAAVEAL